MSRCMFVLEVPREDVVSRVVCARSCLHMHGSLSVLIFVSLVRVSVRRSAVVFNTALCVFSLTQPKGTSCPEKS